ncbi:uncharacterized protein [Branchiostoma lanceolatum]|uniref:uncharacterized protein n=1 Tax=Branchiostoma lanceolatum TaxID=7740 RepID=UPI003451B0B4
MRKEDKQQDIKLPFTVLKVLVSVVFFLGLLFCLSSGKVSIISISGCLAQAGSDNVATGSNSDNMTLVQNCEGQSPETVINMIFIMMMIPYTITFLRCLWVTGLKDIHPWPTGRALVLGLATSSAEVFGLLLFMLKVLTSVEGITGVLFMNNIYIVQILYQFIYEVYKLIWPHRTGERDPSWKWMGIFMVASVLSLGGLVVTTYGVKDSTAGWWIGLISTLLLSFAWSPALQKQQSVSSTRSMCSCDSQDRSNNSKDASLINKTGEDGGFNSSLLTSLWKVLLTPATISLFVWYFQIGDVSIMWSLKSWSNITPDHPAFDEMMINIFCGLGGYLLAIIACSTNAYRIGFALPLLLGNIDAVLLVFIAPLCETFLPNAACQIDEISYYLVIPAAICIYIANSIAVWSLVAQSPTGILEKRSQIFLLPGYNSMFLEQWLVLSRRTKFNSRKQFLRRTKNLRNACVYVCSTMYHESEEEMEQLLLSLRGIANDLQDEGQRHFESHIFFDGGCNNGQPTAWAQQLITLIEKTVCSVGDDAAFGSRWDTPYGLQFSWTIGLKNMPLIVHLKAKSKVRSGKRWSQVMYMSYILNFSGK